jgi:hypothetical protein
MLLYGGEVWNIKNGIKLIDIKEDKHFQKNILARHLDRTWNKEIL